jgi:glycosyltransferase involved in cell wall biosynthesis
MEETNFNPTQEFMDYLYPRITVVIPTYNNSQNIGYTLDNVLKQSYPDLEVIIVDAGSTDRTLDIVNGYFSPKVRICSVATYQVYEMLNKGISLATGKYINFLAPGDYYLSETSLKSLTNLSLNGEKPHLMFGACLLRDGKFEPRILYRTLSLSLLQKGLQPTTIQSCLFHHELFSIIGKFRTHYKLRGEFELFCRFILYPGLRFKTTKNVLIDFDFKSVYRKNIWIHFKETFKIIRHHFGFITAFRWLFYQKDLGRMARIWARGLKRAFIGR